MCFSRHRHTHRNKAGNTDCGRGRKNAAPGRRRQVCSHGQAPRRNAGPASVARCLPVPIRRAAGCHAGNMRRSGKLRLDWCNRICKPSRWPLRGIVGHDLRPENQQKPSTWLSQPFEEGRQVLNFEGQSSPVRILSRGRPSHTLRSTLRGARRPRTINRRHAAEPNRKGWRAVCRSAPWRLRQ